MLCISILTIICIICIIVCARKNIVASRLTDDALRYGPIEYEGEIYFPSSYTFPEDRNTSVFGYIAPKDMDILVHMIMNDKVVADKDDQNHIHLKTKGDDSTRFTKAVFLEDHNLVKENFKKYSEFVFCYTDDMHKNIRIPVDKDILFKLEKQFSEVQYNIEDFDKYKEIYYIYVDSQSIISETGDPIVYIGCIFVVEQELYYGNMDNKIEGELYDELITVIGY